MKFHNFFFHTCQSDGKERISFTYPPSLSTFFGMIQKKMSLFIRKTLSSDELYNQWSYKNEQKRKHLNNQFFNRVKTLDKFLDNKLKNLDVLEKRTRLLIKRLIYKIHILKYRKRFDHPLHI